MTPVDLHGFKHLPDGWKTTPEKTKRKCDIPVVECAMSLNQPKTATIAYIAIAPKMMQETTDLLICSDNWGAINNKYNSNNGTGGLGSYETDKADCTSRGLQTWYFGLTTRGTYILPRTWRRLWSYFSDACNHREDLLLLCVCQPWDIILKVHRKPMKISDRFLCVQTMVRNRAKTLKIRCNSMKIYSCCVCQ